LKPARALALIAPLLLSCSGLMPRIDSKPAAEEPAAETDTATDLLDPDDEEEQVHEDLEQEEQSLESQSELDQLISKLNADQPGQAPAAATPAQPIPGSGDRPAIPVALDNWRQTDEQCLARLAEHGVRTSRPDFDTPQVKAPVLLEGPILGVEIRARWPRANRVNEVMDCRLALALVAVAHEAKRGGIEQILFYSTYRPLKPPPETCDKGQAGASCRKAKRKYEKALKKKHAQHRKALAIDIRWFVDNSGETIDVLEHYERKDKHPPCADEPETDAGRFLVELACTLHELGIFHVMLTPNSNKAHHNHFHFDITPDSTWYAIK
jgi:hypothetical protein